MRLSWLDFQKGIAIFLVVMGHVYQTCLRDTGPIFSLIYTFHMPFFFMLSGILAWKANERVFMEILRKKIISLLLPFFTCGLAFSLTYDEVKNFFVSEFHAGYWFLLSLLTCWIIFIPFLRISKRIPCFKGKLLFDVIILLMPFFIFKILTPLKLNESVDFLSLGFTFAFYRFFVMGYFVGLLIKRFGLYENMCNRLVISVMCIVFFSLTVSYLKNVSWINRVPITMLQLLFCIGFFCTLVLYKEFSSSHICLRIEQVGRNSLSIYCFHFFVFKLIDLTFLSIYSTIIKLIVSVIISVLIISLVLLLTVPLKNKYLSYIFLGKK